MISRTNFFFINVDVTDFSDVYVQIFSTYKFLLFSWMKTFHINNDLFLKANRDSEIW